MKGVALLLTTQNLGKTFGSQPLFLEISLNVFDGDRLGLIGPNGSGKSTLIQILAGRIDPDTGNVAYRKNGIGMAIRRDIFLSRRR